MSYVNNISQAATASATNNDLYSGSSSQDVMGKEDFLTLLVAQLTNQDPLNPDDPTEFTAQLAQFSSLEQLFNLNDSMNNLVTSNANADRFATLQTIGKYVVYQDSTFEYEAGDKVELGYQLDGNASEVTLSIQKDGATIDTFSASELSKGNHFITWDGLKDSENPAASGTYTITISAKAAEGESVAASPLIKSEVTGVDLTGDYGGKLMTKAGEVDFNTILGVYEIPTDKDEDDNENDSSLSLSNDSLNLATGDVAFNAGKKGVKDDDKVSFNLKM